MSYNVAVVVFMRVDTGVDLGDAISVGEALVKTSIGGKGDISMARGDQTWTGKVVEVVEADRAFRNGYFNVDPGSKAFRYADG